MTETASMMLQMNFTSYTKWFSKLFCQGVYSSPVGNSTEDSKNTAANHDTLMWYERNCKHDMTNEFYLIIKLLDSRDQTLNVANIPEFHQFQT